MTEAKDSQKLVEKKAKTLAYSSYPQAEKSVPDIAKFGDPDKWRCMVKISSQREGWMKSTKVMEVEGVGCLVQVTTQQGSSIAEAVTFVPGVKLVGDAENLKFVPIG